MEFELDKQTLDDLEVFKDDESSFSIFKYYNETKTKGGQDILYKLMNSPLNEINKLQDRIDFIKYLFQINFELKINDQQFEFIGYYIRLNIPALRKNAFNAFFQNISYLIKPTNEYYLIQQGVKNFIHLLQHFNTSFADLTGNIPKEFKREIEIIQDLLEKDELQKYLNPGNKINYKKLNKLDNIFRKKYFIQVKEVVEAVYRLDAFVSIAKTANRNSLAFPDYTLSNYPTLTIEKLYHPLLKNAVPYDINISEQKNLCFLTGPNMAGKSTFLKTIGLSIYLSHLGFPVPAIKMNTSIYNGIITTINLSDNLNKGFSHFYSEVKRIKETAIKLKDNEKMFVIFDELFRGTNVKDAFDASLLIIKSFAKISKSTFFISTHITEIAEEIKTLNNIKFNYFDSKLIDNKPVFNYKISDGVSHERLGMLIVLNEGIVEILNSIKMIE